MNNLQYLVCKSGYSVLVPERDNYEMSEKQFDVLKLNWGKVAYNGELSKATSRKIAHILEIWNRTIRLQGDKRNLLTANTNKQLIFITLTLSNKQVHSDNEIKRNMLNAFIIGLSRTHKLVNYLWKAEKQKNGNIHFHLVTDIYIKKEELNFAWDTIQFRNSYIKKQPVYSSAYASPSTRIEVISNNNGIANYMAKYVSKNEDNGAVQGRCWGASNSVKKLKDCTFAYDSELQKVIDVYADKNPEKFKVGDFHVTFGKDFFFDIYNICKFHRSKINIWYAALYFELYAESVTFSEIELNHYI